MQFTCVVMQSLWPNIHLYLGFYIICILTIKAKVNNEIMVLPARPHDTLANALMKL